MKKSLCVLVFVLACDPGVAEPEMPPQDAALDSRDSARDALDIDRRDPIDAAIDTSLADSDQAEAGDTSTDGALGGDGSPDASESDASTTDGGQTDATVTLSCSEPAQCGTGLYCYTEDQICEAGCDDDEDCGEGNTCNVATHRCRCGDNRHLCGRLCFDNDSVLTCGNSCSPCTWAPENADPACNNQQCDFACRPGSVRCEYSCAPCSGPGLSFVCGESNYQGVCRTLTCPEGSVPCPLEGSCCSNASLSQTIYAPPGSVQFGTQVRISSNGQWLLVNDRFFTGGWASFLYQRGEDGSFGATPQSTLRGTSVTVGAQGDVSDDGQTIVLGEFVSRAAGSVRVYDRVNGVFPASPTQVIVAPQDDPSIFGVALSGNGQVLAFAHRSATAGAPIVLSVYTRTPGGLFGGPTTVTQSTDASFGTTLVLNADGTSLYVGSTTRIIRFARADGQYSEVSNTPSLAAALYRVAPGGELVAARSGGSPQNNFAHNVGFLVPGGQPGTLSASSLANIVPPTASAGFADLGFDLSGSISGTYLVAVGVHATRHNGHGGLVHIYPVSP